MRYCPATMQYANNILSRIHGTDLFRLLISTSKPPIILEAYRCAGAFRPHEVSNKPFCRPPRVARVRPMGNCDASKLKKMHDTNASVQSFSITGRF